MNEVHAIMNSSSDEKRYQMACSFHRMIILFNQWLDEGYTFQGGISLEELACLALIYPYKDMKHVHL
jgi:hypothetical protein